MDDWRIKICVLWLFSVLIGLMTTLIGLFEPGVIEQVMAGQLEGQNLGPEVLLVLTLFLLIPLVMAFLTLILKSTVNRWANIVVGIVFVVLGLSDLPGNIADPSAYALVLNISVVVAIALIVWIAWKSKQKT